MARYAAAVTIKQRGKQSNRHDEQRRGTAMLQMTNCDRPRQKERAYYYTKHAARKFSARQVNF
jgi:hypothetical protein